MELKSPYGLRYVLPLHPLSNLRLRRIARTTARKFAEGQRAARTVIEELGNYTEDDSSLEIDCRFYEVVYVLLAFLVDVNLSVVALTRTRVPSERHLLLRIICLHLYEASSLANSFNRDSRALLELRLGEPSLLEEAGSISRSLNRFLERHRSFLRPIRNQSIAHRESSFQEFIAAAESIDEVRILGLLTSFVGSLHGLLTVLSRCSEISHAYFQGQWLRLATARASRVRAHPAGK